MAALQAWIWRYRWPLVAAAAVGGSAALLRWWRRMKDKVPAGPRRVVALGDSWTADGGYVRQLLALLPEGSTAQALGYTGHGVAVIAGHLDEALGLRPNDLIVGAGTNDLPGRSAETIIVGLRGLFTRAKAAGVRLIALELPPVHGYRTVATDAHRARRAQVNKWLRASELPDVVVPMEWLGGEGEALLPQWDRGDHLHPNGAGQAAIGRRVHAEAFGG